MLADLDPHICYRALTARDARFDGQFFVGVSSTGIYCRPVCRVRTPKAANCSFFATAAHAEESGYRPCLKCRPELAPSRTALASGTSLAQAAARFIEDGEVVGVAELAQRVGVTDRHLRRLFETEFGVTPVAYQQTQRLLLAKRLLTDTRLPIVDVALAAGFGSVRRLNELLKARYGLAPANFRKRAAQSLDAHRTNVLEFHLAVRPPYAWDATLAFLAKRSIASVESVADATYRRSLRLVDGKSAIVGTISVRQMRADSLALTVSDSLLPQLPQVLAKSRRLFDCAADPEAVSRALGELVQVPGLRLPGAVDGFEVAVRAILGQQVTVKAAITLAGRLVAAFGDALPPAQMLTGVTHTFPTPARIAQASPDDIARHGIIASRARAIIAVARAINAGELSLAPGSDAEVTQAKLVALPGIGPWTAQYICMRALGWPDVFLPGDLGVRKGLGGITEAAALQFAQRWRPYRAYAVMHLWHQLETAMQD